MPGSPINERTLSHQLFPATFPATALSAVPPRKSLPRLLVLLSSPAASAPILTILSALKTGHPGPSPCSGPLITTPPTKPAFPASGAESILQSTIGPVAAQGRNAGKTFGRWRGHIGMVP